MPRAILALLIAIICAGPARAAAYPASEPGSLRDILFAEPVADPFRWLEGDPAEDRAVSDWIDRQNACTGAYLRTLPARAWFRQRIGALMDFERLGLPTKAGRDYFYTRSAGQQRQPELWVRRGLSGRERRLVGGDAALDDWKPTSDGRLVLFSVTEGGTDGRILRVIDAASGRLLPDVVRHARYTRLAWLGRDGFFYSRFPDAGPNSTSRAPRFGHAVWFHRLGTDQAEDQEVYAAPERPEANHALQVTADGRWAVITSSLGADPRRSVHLIDLAARAQGRGRQGGRGPGWRTIPLVPGFTDDWQLVDSAGGRLLFVTSQSAPEYRLVAVAPRTSKPVWETVVPESSDKLDKVAVLGGKLLLNYIRDGARRGVLVDLAGAPAQEITLADAGTASGFRGSQGSTETFYAFSSFNRPATIYRLDLATGRTSVFAQPRLTFDPERYLVEQRSARSADGTQVPFYLVRARAVAAAGTPVPTLLYGYGGFDIAVTPGFSAARMAWLEAGGALAVANVRGGGEFGPAWHEAGRGRNKPNAFADFVAVGQYLIAQGIAPRGGLAAQGASNGGLLVAASVGLRPDLFAAVSPQSGVLDMLRFDRFTAGRYWLREYGDPAQAGDFKVLRSYSPYHNIRSGSRYPAMIVTTGDDDDRVVPAHSFKYAAALQAADLGDRPRLIRIERGAGHGAGRPADRAAEESADVMAFLARWTGLTPLPEG